MSYEKLDRNREIYGKYREGKTYIDLAKEYGMSTVRVRQIVDQVRRDYLNIPADIPEIKEACKALDVPKWMHGRIQNVLKAKKLHVRNRWRKLDRKDILSFRSMGDLAADVLEYAKKL